MFMYNKDMDYKEYKNKIIQNMPDFNYHGMWKGSIKKHILGNPKTQIEKVDIINKYSILPNVMPIDSETLHLTYTRSSSKFFTNNVLQFFQAHYRRIRQIDKNVSKF